MNFGHYKTIPALLASLIACILVSCASTPKEEEAPVEPVKEPVVKEIELMLPANPTDEWKKLKDDTDLPTSDQLADGAESSMGKGENSPSGDQRDERPSTTIKPPPIEPEDQLAPSE